MSQRDLQVYVKNIILSHYLYTDSIAHGRLGYWMKFDGREELCSILFWQNFEFGFDPALVTRFRVLGFRVLGF